MFVQCYRTYICSFQFATPRFCVAVINTGEMNAYRANWHNHYRTHGSCNLQAYNIEYMRGKNRHTAIRTTKPETECFLRKRTSRFTKERELFEGSCLFRHNQELNRQLSDGRHRAHCC